VLGEKIRKVRKHRGFTLVELAEKIGATHGTLSGIETGRTQAGKKILIALARELHDNFGEAWLDEYINRTDRPAQSRKEILESATVEEIVSLKFGGGNTRRTKAELLALAKILDDELKKDW
jgi:transcriptional regulator with XRE-family HTH domain